MLALIGNKNTFSQCAWNIGNNWCFTYYTYAHGIIVIGHYKSETTCNYCVYVHNSIFKYMIRYAIRALPNWQAHSLYRPIIIELYSFTHKTLQWHCKAFSLSLSLFGHISVAPIYSLFNSFHVKDSFSTLWFSIICCTISINFTVTLVFVICCRLNNVRAKNVMRWINLR